MKTVEADIVEFTREWCDGTYRLCAVVHCQTPRSKKFDKIKLVFNFDCLRYILPSLRSEWLKEKQNRQATINSIDSQFPQ